MIDNEIRLMIDTNLLTNSSEIIAYGYASDKTWSFTISMDDAQKRPEILLLNIKTLISKIQYENSEMAKEIAAFKEWQDAQKSKVEVQND